MTIEEIQLQNLHYFFSTAPQVLGALLAISGAFVAIRINNIKNELNSHSQAMIDFGRPKTQSEIDELIKEYELHEMIVATEHYSMDSLFFGGIYDKLRYVQIAGRYREINELLIKMVIPKLDKFHKPHIKIEDFKNLCKNYETGLSEYFTFIEETKMTYKINGLLLGVLIVYFFFIPYVNHGIGYWITLISGIAITITSLALIVSYLIDSIVLSKEKQVVEKD